MLKIAVLAVAATIAGPGYSASVDEGDVARLAKTRTVDEALRTLVERKWIEGEAHERGITLSDPDADDQDRADQLLAEIRAQVSEPAARSVTPDQVKAYVDAHPKINPASRTVRIVRAKNRASAIRIKRKLERGASWASVGATRDERAMGKDRITRAIFRAKVNRTTRYGRVVFKVLKHAPARPLNRAQQEQLAWEELTSAAQERALNAFTAQFTEKWRARTACAPRYVTHPSCAAPPSSQEAP